MDEKALKRRNWVKNIAIIFLAVMLVLTLFSNTIMNFSLPEVSAQYCYSGTITSRIRGSGTVEAKDTYVVNAPSTSKIKDIGIKVGSRVEIGDVMFLLEETAESNLITALQELADLKKEYNTKIGELGGDYLDKQLAIAEAQAAVTEAKNKRKAADEAKVKLAEVKASLKQIQKSIDELTLKKQKIDAKIGQLELIDGIDEANASLNEAIKALERLENEKIKTENALEAAKADAERKAEELADAQDALQEFEKQNSGAVVDEAALIAKIREIDDLERQYAYDLEDYNTAQQEFNSSLQTLYSAWQTAVAEYNSALQNGIEGEELLELETACKNAEKAYNDAANNIPDNLKEMQRALENAAINIQYKREDLEKLQEQYENSEKYADRLQDYKDEVDFCESAKKTADKNLANAEKKKNETETAYKEAKELVDLLTSADSLKSLKAESESLDTQIDALTAEKETAGEKQTELNEIISADVSDPQLKTLENNAAKLQKELSQLMEQNKAATEVIQMELDIINKKIEDKEAEIEKIKAGDFTTEVKAPIAGVISSIDVQAGQDVQFNVTKLAEIQLVDKGYSVSFNVTNEQAKRIRIGDRANIQYWWGGDITATVESIKPDQSNPSQSKTVTLNITGDVNVGTNLSFTIGEKSQDFESVIPNSAIREDNNGKFVLVVEAKSTPLGNRYTARRMDIEVIASDETSSAVSGITYGDFVITASTEPVIAGKQVRLVET
jgi:chromosome segregation ATPase